MRFFAFSAFPNWVKKRIVPLRRGRSLLFLRVLVSAGERCWPLLAGMWRAIAPLMKAWCAEGDVPTAANLNLYRGLHSRVGWHCDDEPLFGRAGCSELIVSVSFGSTALFKWKGKFCPDSDVNSCYVGHGDILVMGGQCQDEANVRTSFFTVRIPVWNRSGFMLRSVGSGSILLPALFELG